MGDIFKLNQRFNDLFKQNQQQQKENNMLRSENHRILNELEQCKTSYNDLLARHKQTSNELIATKYATNNKLEELNQHCIEYEERFNVLASECNKYQQIALLFGSQQTKNQYLNGCVSLDYYHQILINDGLKRGNKIFETKYNALNEKYKALLDKNNENLSHYQLESVIIEQNKRHNVLTKALHVEKQKYFERVIRFSDDLETIYEKTEAAMDENNRMKQETKKKTFVLQRENDKLRATLKQSHSNLRVKQTENESKSIQTMQEHQEKVQKINGTKVDLEKRCNVLKNAINDLNGALSDAHIQMLTFQKQVFDEMDCSKTSDNQLLIYQKNKTETKAKIKVPSSPKAHKLITRKLKRPREEALDKQSSASTPTSKRRKKSNVNVDIDSSSSSEISHSSHQSDADLYLFQAPLDENSERNADDRTFYSILTNTKSESYILSNEYIKITRRGHPDYIGRVESMFFDRKENKKKVCVRIFHLASDIPNIHQCEIENEEINERFQEGKREYVELILSAKHKQFKAQKESTKIFGVGRIQRNKKVMIWFPKKHISFKKIEKLTSGRDVFFCRYRYNRNTKTLTRINGTDDGPSSDFQ